MARKIKTNESDVERVSKDTERILAELQNKHVKQIEKAIHDLENRMLLNLKKLETNKSGRLEGTKVNLKQTQEIHKQMLRIFKEEYGGALDDIMKDFDAVARLIGRSWGYLDDAAKFAGVDKDAITLLKNQTYEQFEEFGTAAQKRIAQGMYSSIAAGAEYSGLVKTIRGILTGYKDVRGRPMAVYSKQFAFDAVMNFHNQVNLFKAEGLGIEHYLYVGDVMDTTRIFCEEKAGNVYSKEEIESWDDMDWKGKAGPPLQFRGGYNCRHHWRPVRPDWLPDKEVDPENNSKDEETD